jgi:hypothetical protein
MHPRTVLVVAAMPVMLAVCASACSKKEAEVTAPGSASSAAATASTALAAAAPPASRTPDPPSWTGNYACFDGLELTHLGEEVTARYSVTPTQSTALTCTVKGIECIGTTYTMTHARGKAPKVGATKKVTLHRDESGDLLFQVEGDSRTTSCKKK